MNDAEVKAKRLRFQRLHEDGCFVIPNPWDVGSARYLEMMGFQALATTSSGYAFSRGLPDDDSVTVDEALGHYRELTAATRIPVNADFKGAYAVEPEGVAENVLRCVECGVAGLSVEDMTSDAREPLYEFALAVERVRAARRAIDASGSGVVLTARTECYLTGHRTPAAEAVRRLAAFAEAGADVLYAPGAKSAEEIGAIVGAVRPKPVNVLVVSNAGMSVRGLAELGVRRISVGSALARAAWTGFVRAAEGMVKEGSFAGLDGIVPFGEINGCFGRFLKEE